MGIFGLTGALRFCRPVRWSLTAHILCRKAITCSVWDSHALRAIISPVCVCVCVCVCVLQFLLLNSLLTAASQLGRGPDYLNHVEMACGASMRACGETLTNDWQHK